MDKKEMIEAFRNKSPVALVGKHPLYLEALYDAAIAARNGAPVLIFGETGTGKEIIARAIHANSGRSKGPFLAVNCGIFEPSLLESRLFGHKKGSFTGATEDRAGYFTTAHGGTILLDEIQALELGLQNALLRVIETGEFLPVGSDATVKSNARIIATAKQDISAKVHEGKFLLDLIMRFPHQVYMPSLRERPDDIPSVAEQLLSEINRELKRNHSFSQNAIGFLNHRKWFGNIRELRTAIEMTVKRSRPTEEIIMAENIQVSKISFERVTDERESAPVASDVIALAAGILIEDPLLDLEKLTDQIIQETLKRCGDIHKAADCLGITDRTIRNHLRRGKK